MSGFYTQGTMQCDSYCLVFYYLWQFHISFQLVERNFAIFSCYQLTKLALFFFFFWMNFTIFPVTDLHGVSRNQLTNFVVFSLQPNDEIWFPPPPLNRLMNFAIFFSQPIVRFSNIFSCDQLTNFTFHPDRFSKFMSLPSPFFLTEKFSNFFPSAGWWSSQFYSYDW